MLTYRIEEMFIITCIITIDVMTNEETDCTVLPILHR